MRTPPTSSARQLCYLAITLIVFAVAASVPASAVSGAAFTTFDASQGGCLDGSHPNGINCNNYAHKEDVYMNGGPTAGGIAAGNYYFTVLAPGSQNGGFIDFAPGNLSTGSSGECGGGTGSPATQPSDRSFTKNSDGTITNTGTHANGTDPQPEPVIQLAPYCDTPNMGGVYILAICEIGATAPSQCKYDAFKIKKQECTTDCGGASQATLSVCKFWDQNADHIWDNGEPFIGAWPITATNVDTVGGPVGTLTSDTINDSANPSFGCVTFTHTFADGETFADVTLSEGNAPDPTASPASQSCDASLTCQTTPSGPWTQSAPFVSNAVQPTETITLKPGDNLNADNFGNYIAATAPGVSKTALGGYTDTFTWTITKSVDKTTVETSGTTATFNYTITVTHDAGTVTGVNVGGIQVAERRP